MKFGVEKHHAEQKFQCQFGHIEEILPVAKDNVHCYSAHSKLAYVCQLTFWLSTRK